MQTTLEKLVIINSKITEVKFSVVLSRAEKLQILNDPSEPCNYASNWADIDGAIKLAKIWQLKPNPDYAESPYESAFDIIWDAQWMAIYDAVESFMKQAYQLGLIEKLDWSTLDILDFYEARQPACE